MYQIPAPRSGSRTSLEGTHGVLLLNSELLRLVWPSINWLYWASCGVGRIRIMGLAKDKVKLFPIMFLTLLLLPALIWSLRTPFGLIDDYTDWRWIFIGENMKAWIVKTVFHVHCGRYRPVFEFANFLSWHLYGPNPLLHHASRWAMKTISFIVWLCCLNVLRNRMTNQAPGPVHKPFCKIDLPIIVFAYLFFLFPNNPEARLAPQELYTGFFLSLTNWAVIRLLLFRNGDMGCASAIDLFLLYSGVVGLALSKEPNIVFVLVVPMFFLTLRGRNISLKTLIRILPFLVLAAHTIWKIYGVYSCGGYGTDIARDVEILGHANYLIRHILMTPESYLLSAFLIFFLLFSIKDLKKVVVALIRENKLMGVKDKKAVYSFFLFLQIIAFSCILCVSRKICLRYWYPIIPLLSTLLALSVRKFLEWKARVNHLLSGQAIVSVFLLFFICSVYANFLMQFAVQYHARNIENRLLNQVEALAITGHPVVVEGRDEFEHKVMCYFNEFMPYFFHRRIRVAMVNLYYKSLPNWFGKYIPLGTGVPAGFHYLVSRKPQIGGYRLIEKIQDNSFWCNNMLLLTSYNVSKLLRFRDRPYIHLDCGAQPMSYVWYLYEKR